MVQLNGLPIITRIEGSKISIGQRSVLTSVSTRTALGVNHAVILRTLLPGAEIVIEEDVGISGGSICAAIGITIGRASLLGANVTIADTDFHALRTRDRRYSGLPTACDADRVTIGANVFLGTNSIVLKGVAIGDHAIIGAGSVLTRSVPAGAVCAGFPARVVGNWLE